MCLMACLSVKLEPLQVEQHINIFNIFRSSGMEGTEHRFELRGELLDLTK
jgi:hypothetical protein